MKIFIDINHPAYVHFFYNYIREMEKLGHSFCVTARDKDCVFHLLDHYGIDYISKGRGAESLPGKIFYNLVANVKLLKLFRTFKPELAVSFASPYLTQVAWLNSVPSLVIIDLECNKWLNRLTFPFATRVLTPLTFKRELGDKHIRFNAHWPYAYLHPNYFNPLDDAYELLGIAKGEKYMLIRSVSRNTTHDIGQHRVMDHDFLARIVGLFSKYAKVFISSEVPLPSELENYLVPFSPDKMLSVLGNAQLVYGESATMATEAALLGTPAIFIDQNGRGFTQELEEKHGIVFNFNTGQDDIEASVAKALELLKLGNKEAFMRKKEEILAENIDLTDFLINLSLDYRQHTSNGDS